MAIEYEIDTKDGIVSLHFSSPPVMEDYQSTFPNVLREVAAARTERWLLALDYSEPSSDDKVHGFSEFVAQEISRYVKKMAVVCPLQGHARINDVLEPIRNQGKPIEMFETVDEARHWLRQ
ncbi:MAG: hypothetical protein V2I51_19620 [Anderseniella sp.]|jgi:hypothetical protein|nr:hypothetical protein [Anderseniella sp.]